MLNTYRVTWKELHVKRNLTRQNGVVVFFDIFLGNKFFIPHQSIHVVNEMYNAADLFKDDVDVTSNKLSYLLSLSGLHRIVTVLVISKVLKAEQTTIS